MRQRFCIKGASFDVTSPPPKQNSAAADPLGNDTRALALLHHRAVVVRSFALARERTWACRRGALATVDPGLNASRFHHRDGWFRCASRPNKEVRKDGGTRLLLHLAVGPPDSPERARGFHQVGPRVRTAAATGRTSPCQSTNSIAKNRTVTNRIHTLPKYWELCGSEGAKRITDC